MTVREALDEHVGRAGRMLHGGKQAKPGHEVYWNACVFTEDGRQVWFGDVDLTAESEKLQRAADASEQTLLLTPEQPFRFSGLRGDQRGMRDVRPEDRERIRSFIPAMAA